MKFRWKEGITLIDLEKGENLLINHKGSVRFLEIEVDKYDDICFSSRENLKDKTFCPRCESFFDKNHSCFTKDKKGDIN